MIITGLCGYKFDSYPQGIRLLLGDSQTDSKFWAYIIPFSRFSTAVFQSTAAKRKEKKRQQNPNKKIHMVPNPHNENHGHEGCLSFCGLPRYLGFALKKKKLGFRSEWVEVPMKQDWVQDEVE